MQCLLAAVIVPGLPSSQLQLQLSSRCRSNSLPCSVSFAQCLVRPLGCHNQLSTWWFLAADMRWQQYIDLAWGSLANPASLTERATTCLMRSGLPGKEPVAGCKAYPYQRASPVHVYHTHFAHTCVKQDLYETIIAGNWRQRA